MELTKSNCQDHVALPGGCPQIFSTWFWSTVQRSWTGEPVSHRQTSTRGPSPSPATDGPPPRGTSVEGDTVWAAGPAEALSPGVFVQQGPQSVWPVITEHRRPGRRTNSRTFTLTAPEAGVRGQGAAGWGSGDGPLLSDSASACLPLCPREAAGRLAPWAPSIRPPSHLEGAR